MKDQQALIDADPKNEARVRLDALIRAREQQEKTPPPTITDRPRPTSKPRRPNPSTATEPSPPAATPVPGAAAPARDAATLPSASPWPSGKAGRLVERWLPGGTHGVAGARAMARRHLFAIVVLLIVLVVAICTAIAMSGRQQMAEAAPPLPAAISAGPSTAATTSAPPPATLVISVVGRVAHPGLVTLLDGARVADAIRVAGGAIPGTNDLALNLARKLADGEQIYVGIPVPADAAPADDPTQPSAANSSTAPTAKIDLNTATADQLDALPGVGPATAQHILAWRQQHGHFGSVGQLRDVEGIGDGRFAKIEKLVTI